MESIQATSTPPTYTPPPSPAIASAKAWPILPVLLSLLVLLLLLSTSYFGYQNMQLQKQLADLSKPAPLSTPTPMPDPTANWQTYTSIILGFTIRYPQTWFIEHEDNTRVRIQNYDPKTAPGRGYDATEDKGKFAFQIGLQNIAGPQSVELLKAALSQEKECFFMGDPAGTTVVSDEKTGNINGHATYTRTKKCSASPNSAETTTYILDGKGKVLSASALLDITSEASTFDQILSTFQFTLNTPPITPKDETQNWTSYTDKDTPFQIKYPTNWNLRKTYGKSIGNTGNYRVSGVDISTNLSIGSTVVVNIIDPQGNSFFDWMRLYSGETNPPTTTNSYYKNIPAIRIERPNQGKPATIHTYFEDGGYIVFMAANTSLTDQPIGEQILSTFTFTN